VGAAAAAFCARPGPAVRGVLLHGPDAGLVALRRRQLVGFLTDADDLRLTRLEAAVAQKDPAEIDSALRARGFFPGRRVVLIEGARDSLAKPLKEILAGLGSGQPDEDPVLVMTAQNLTARSSLRRLFEGAGDLASLGLYPEPPGEAELVEMLRTAAPQTQLTPDALQELVAAAVQSDRGALQQLVEKIAVYAMDRDDPIGAGEMVRLLPAASDSDLDRLVSAVAEGRADAVGPLIGRLGAAGIGAAGMLIATGRHFRQLLGLAAARDGIDAALGRLRPPAFGPRRRALASQARRWGPQRLESANRLLFQADRTLRSPGERPDRALVERCLIRLAMMAGRG
jgi:DNA polymerase-3 subunit delta